MNWNYWKKYSKKALELSDSLKELPMATSRKKGIQEK